MKNKEIQMKNTRKHLVCNTILLFLGMFLT